MVGRPSLALSALLLALCVAVTCVLVTVAPGGGQGPAAVGPEAVAEPSPVDLAFTDVPPRDPVQLPDDLPATTQPAAVERASTPPAPVDAAAPPAVQTAPPATGPVRGETTGVQRGSAKERGQAALASLPYPYRELGVSIAFRDYRGGTLGLFEPPTRRITIFVKPTQSTQGLRVTIAHELGHALDQVVNTAATRRSYLAARGVSPRTAWLPCGRCSDYASGAGDFAEVFALHVAGRGDFRSRLAGEPTDAQLVVLSRFFRPPSERETLLEALVPAQPTKAPQPVAAAPVPPPATPKPKPVPVPTPTRCQLLDALLGGC